MQTVYSTVSPKAIHGLALIAPSRTRPMMQTPSYEVQSLTIPGGSGTTDVVLTILDRKSGVSYTVTATGSATEATVLANVLAAVRAHPKVNLLLSVADNGTSSDVIVAFTARHPSQQYTITSTGGPANTAATATVTTAAFAAGLAPGQLVVRGSGDDEFGVLTASSVVGDIVGFLDRRNANIYHSLENDTPSATDACLRGRTLSIAQAGEFYVTVQEAVTPASRVRVRVEGTTVGDWGTAAAGDQQIYTLTPTAANSTEFGIEFDYTDSSGVLRHYSAQMVSDASGTAIEICNGLRTGLGTISGLTFGGTVTLTITPAAGTELLNLRSTADGVIAIVETNGEDVDMLDVSSIAKYMSTASAGQLARLRINIVP